MSSKNLIEATRVHVSTTRVYAAVHQDSLLEALTTGVFGPPLLDLREGKPVVSGLRAFLIPELPSRVHDEARADHSGGATCVVALDIPTDGLQELAAGQLFIRFPIPLCFASEVFVRSERIIREITARAELFPDVVPGALTFRLGPENSNTRQGADSTSRSGATPDEQLMLSGDTEEKAAVPPWPELPLLDFAGAENLLVLDKAGGMLACVCASVMDEIAENHDASSRGEMILSSLLVALGGEGSSWARRAATAVAEVVLRGDAYAADRSVLSALAGLLARSKVSDGFSSAELLIQAVDSATSETTPGSNSIAGELKEFSQAARLILSARQELRPEHLTDAGHPGLRGVLVFLLNGTPEHLERFLKLRPSTGATVRLVARTLMGIYSGLAGLPRGLKAPTPDVLGAFSDIISGALASHPRRVTIREDDTLEIVLFVGRNALLRIPGKLDPDLVRLRDVLSALPAEVRRGTDPATLVARVSSGDETTESLELRCRLAESGSQFPLARCVLIETSVPRPTTLQKLLVAWSESGKGRVMARPADTEGTEIVLSASVAWASLSDGVVREAARALRSARTVWAPNKRVSPRSRAPRSSGDAPVTRTRKKTKKFDDAPPEVIEP